VELPKEHHSSTPLAPVAKEAPAVIASTPVSSGGIEPQVSPQRVIESNKPAISSNAVVVAPVTPEVTAPAVASTEEVAPVEEIAAPEENVVVEEPEASGSDLEGANTGGVEAIESATAASPTTVPGAHSGKGTVTVTVTPETPSTTPSSPTPPPATTAPPATIPPPAETPPVETETPPVIETPVEVPPATEITP
ncbi:MAG: hypothetical protein J0H06_04360, partial [Actinobacteria bacterium]|nr:hypothetical protein [Actinomycetota bacterium]